MAPIEEATPGPQDKRIAERDKTISSEEHKARNAARLAALNKHYARC